MTKNLEMSSHCSERIAQQLCIPQPQGKVNICVFTETQTTCLSLCLKLNVGCRWSYKETVRMQWRTLSSPVYWLKIVLSRCLGKGRNRLGILKDEKVNRLFNLILISCFLGLQSQFLNTWRLQYFCVEVHLSCCFLFISW